MAFAAGSHHPGLDASRPVGLALAKRWRGETAHARVAVIMLTARADETDKIAGLDAGADDYLDQAVSRPTS